MWIEEPRGINVFFVPDDGSLRTPPLSGTILPGIMRVSMIELATREGIAVDKSPYAFGLFAQIILPE